MSTIFVDPRCTWCHRLILVNAPAQQELLVIRNETLVRDFAAVMRRQGVLLAKGRFVGVQFRALMTDGLYFEIGRQAVSMARRLREAFVSVGIEPEGDSLANQ